MPDAPFLINRTPDALDLPLPARQSALAAGFDLHANIHEDVVIAPRERKLIPSGIRIALPAGYEAQVRPRSGLALRHGVTVLNTPGTVDADFRGELCVLLVNLGQDNFVVKRGDRVAQLVIARVEMVSFTEVDELPDSARGAGGYGSTGK